jgi:glycosyltransferase involved in cell wall biosynthesis
VIANARACATVAAEHAGIAPERFDVVSNGVSIPPTIPPHFREVLRAGLDCPPRRPLCLFVGRLVPEKNLPCLIRAMARLPPGQRPWIALAGDGPLRAEMQALVDAERLGADMRFLGERADATVLMQAADFLVLPSMQEGMSNAVLEAMSSGCAVIASAVGGNRELVEHGVSGLLFPNDDEQALGECLRLLGSDEGLRTRLASQARERARSAFGIDDMVAATAAVYERCLPAPVAPDAQRGSLLRRQRPAGGEL